MEKCCSKSVPECGCGHDNKVSQITSKLSASDVLGTWKVRFGIGRRNYKAAPGLYKIGTPCSESHILVTANYKMSLDSLRKELDGINAWILVLDTKGVNVWCAAGKGTFGTKELVHRIQKVGLSDVVSHKNIILPQLGAVGVAAHKVKKATGFNVIYGPVRAEDIPEFLKNGLVADKQMRTVRFNLEDRAALVPMELVGAVKPTLLTLGVFFMSNAVGLTKVSNKDAKAFIGAVMTGTVLTPVLLPAVPGRAFSLKGWLLGLVWALCASEGSGMLRGQTRDFLKTAQYLLILPSVSALHALNFTGSSTYTSVSGVKKETKIAVPLVGLSLAAGILLMIKSGLSKSK